METGFFEKPVNPMSDENKTLRKYAHLMRPCLNPLDGQIGFQILPLFSWEYLEVKTLLTCTALLKHWKICPMVSQALIIWMLVGWGPQMPTRLQVDFHWDQIPIIT